MYVSQRVLPHEGVIPGARGHKKIVVPKGTTVFVITHESKLYWACYLRAEQARECLEGLVACLDPKAKRHISLESLLAWNFSREFPKRVVRPSVSKPALIA